MHIIHDQVIWRPYHLAGGHITLLEAILPCWRPYYLAGGHVRDGAVCLDGLQLVEAPVQLLQRLPSALISQHFTFISPPGLPWHSSRPRVPIWRGGWMPDLTPGKAVATWEWEYVTILYWSSGWPVCGGHIGEGDVVVAHAAQACQDLKGF